MYEQRLMQAQQAAANNVGATDGDSKIILPH
jgi:hypothetical protein